jgi:putative ABC transport system permease protein
MVVGFDPTAPLGGPWNVVDGNPADLKTADNVFIDEIYQAKLGVSRRGQIVEIGGRRARIVGFTRGIRSFTTSPYVFTSIKNAQLYANVAADQTVFLLVKTVPGVSPEALRAALAPRLHDVDIRTTREFSRMTQRYWMFTTGAGVAVLLAALLGLVVGIVIVAQTIYATTMDPLREYGTLKAMGATNAYLYRVIMQQAVISAAIGYALAMVVSHCVVEGSQRGGAAILLPLPLAVGMLGLTVLMCVGAALVSINKVTRLDPAVVFKG